MERPPTWAVAQPAATPQPKTSRKGSTWSGQRAASEPTSLGGESARRSTWEPSERRLPCSSAEWSALGGSEWVMLGGAPTGIISLSAGTDAGVAGQAAPPARERALRDLDAKREGRDYSAGDAFSTADCVLLPFLFRIRKELEIPADASRLRGYLDRAFAHPSFRRTVAEPYWWWW